MPTIEQSIDVQVPVATAYAQWTQFESFPEFMGGVEGVQQLSDTLTHWRTTVGGVVTFHKLSDDTTRVMVQIDWAAESLTEKAGAAVGVDDLQVKRDLGRFKEFIETRGTATGAWHGEVPRD